MKSVFIVSHKEGKYFIGEGDADPIGGMGYCFTKKQYHRHVILKGKTVMVKAPNRGGPWTRMSTNLF